MEGDEPNALHLLVQIPEWADVIDLREPEELLDALTSPDAPARMRILSWSGREDRELGLSDLEAS